VIDSVLRRADLLLLEPQESCNGSALGESHHLNRQPGFPGSLKGGCKTRLPDPFLPRKRIATERGPIGPGGGESRAGYDSMSARYLR